MYHNRRATTALLVGLLLCAAAPAVVQAAGTTPLDQNLLANPGFEEVATGDAPDTIPQWSVVGDVHVKTFGTKFPNQAYADRYDGGKQYLDCGKSAGLVRQTIELNGRAYLPKQLKVRIKADIGGTTGHIARVVLRILGGSGGDTSSEQTRALTVTNHYLNVAQTALVPLWAERIEATLELKPKAGATQCKIMADNVELWIFRP